MVPVQTNPGPSPGAQQRRAAGQKENAQAALLAPTLSENR
jgi:hypothetical protein